MFYVPQPMITWTSIASGFLTFLAGTATTSKLLQTSNSHFGLAVSLLTALSGLTLLAESLLDVWWPIACFGVPSMYNQRVGFVLRAFEQVGDLNSWVFTCHYLEKGL